MASDVDRLLTRSAAKSIALVEVVACEYQARSDGLRALVLVDAESAAAVANLFPMREIWVFITLSPVFGNFALSRNFFADSMAQRITVAWSSQLCEISLDGDQVFSSCKRF